MARTSVGVLRGGTSSEYNLSLKTGAAILAALPEEKYDVRDIFIDKSGMWHQRGIPVNPGRALSQVDVVLNGLHGGIGEDGTVQRLLERFNIPYAGSRSLPSRIALNKIRARSVFRKEGIPMPQAAAFDIEHGLDTGTMARHVFELFGPPYIVKPPTEGASNGILYVATIVELPDALGKVLDAYGTALVEQYLFGEDVTVGVAENFRGEELYAFPPVHLEFPDDHLHISRHHHEEGILQHHVPSAFSHSEKQSLMDLARAAHRALGLSHFSRADFILTRRGPYLLETNAYPGFYKGSAFPHMLEAVGSSTREFLKHGLHLAY